ncbi:MAG TPA: serine/threonine-protein kinase [Polyangiaceae bacterium]|nr:serine/threonine-protein kinase [Polyangiaceae bacterium]
MDGADDELLEGARARVGRVLKDKWHLDKLLGLGGMAAVYEATHRNRSRVAVKMLHPSLSLDREVRQRFLREGYVANSVEHEGVVRVLDDDVDEDGTAFLVLELLEGETLDARWARGGGRLPIEEVVPLMARILDVLAAAHAKGIVHRDVKPENIFLTNRGEVKLLDFGIARLRETAQSSEQAALTRSGATMGTPVFMAPEQARGRWEQVDERTDVWALGAMMFTLLSGHWVHEAETWNETLILAAIRPARSLGEVVPEAPTALVSVVDRALAFEKADRWASAQAMQAALRALSPAELLPQRLEYLRTQPVPGEVRVGFGKGDADPLSATDPGLGWPSVLGTRPPQSEPGRAPLASGPGRGSLASTPGRGSLASLASSARGSRPDSSPAFALAPSPTVVPATLRASPDDDDEPAPRPRSRFPTWVVLLAVAGAGVYMFRDELVPHLDAWSARGAVSAAPAAGRPDVAESVMGRAEGDGRDATPPPTPAPSAPTHEPAAAASPEPTPPPPPTAEPSEADSAPPAPEPSAAAPGPLIVPPPAATAPAPPKPPAPAAKPPPPPPKKPPAPPKPPPRSTKTHKAPSKHRH